MLGEVSSTLVLILALFAVISFVISISTLLYLRYAVRKDNKVIATIWTLKDHLQKQISEVEEKADKDTKGHKAWEESLKKWLNGELQKQHLANEASVAKVAAAIETIAKSRESMARSFGEFVGLMRAAMRAEKALLDSVKPSLPEKPINPTRIVEEK